MIPPPIFSFPPKPIKPVHQGDDYLDLLPDPILSIILNRVLDAKSLCRCLVVSKRLASLVPQVDTVSVVAKPTLYPNKPFSKTFLKSLFAKLRILRPANKAPNFIGPAELSQWISSSIISFPEIRHLRVELPDNGGIVGFPETGGLLKWSAEFGKELQRCAVLGATAFEKPSGGHTCVTDSNSDPNPKPDQNLHSQNMLSDEELRSRVVWILSSLIAACARHGVTRKTLLESPDLRSAVIVDARKQGRLSMNENQIKELRESSAETVDPIWKRTTVPNVIVKLWYAPELMLPTSGYVMKGATVVAIRPDTGRPQDVVAIDKEYELLRAGFGGREAEEDVIGEAVREIVKSKWRKLTYKLQMNSF